MSNLIAYFEKYALLSLEKQDRLARLIGEYYAELDLDAGRIRFHENLEFPFQVLGTQSDNTLTWLWAWSEEQAEIPENLIKSALDLREWGAREEVVEFTESEIDLDRADGNVISMIASEICRASCYYRDPYEGGALFILLFGEAIDSQPSLDLSRLTHHLRELASAYEFNHRKALLAYLRAKNLAPTEAGNIVNCLLESGETLGTEFDNYGRMIRKD